MTNYINPSVRHDGAKQIIVPDRRAPFQVYEAPVDDGLYVRSNGEWVAHPLGDVDVAGAAVGDVLYFDGSEWTRKASLATAWANASLINSWANYGTPTGHNAQYRKTEDGFVVLQGLVKNGTASNIFTLPVGFRPAATMRFVQRSSTGFARVDVTTGGTVTVAGYVSGGSNTDVALDGIMFEPG